VLPGIVRKYMSKGANFGSSLCLRKLTANFAARIRGRMEIEVPIATDQIFRLFRGQVRLSVNGACDGASRDGNLRPRIRSRGCWTVKMRCDNRTSESTELNVIFEFVGRGIQRGSQRSSTGAAFGRDFCGGLQVCFERYGCGLGCNRHKRKNRCCDDGSDKTIQTSQFTSPSAGVRFNHPHM